MRKNEVRFNLLNLVAVVRIGRAGLDELTDCGNCDGDKKNR